MTAKHRRDGNVAAHRIAAKNAAVRDNTCRRNVTVNAWPRCRSRHSENARSPSPASTIPRATYRLVAPDGGTNFWMR